MFPQCFGKSAECSNHHRDYFSFSLPKPYEGLMAKSWYIIITGLLDWHLSILPCLPPLGHWFKSHQGNYVDWVFSPYLTALVFPGVIL